jgi:hypothetical protein
MEKFNLKVLRSQVGLEHLDAEVEINNAGKQLE